MKKYALLYICTGKYVAFWKEFYESFEKHFLPAEEKEYFVFTDAPALEYEESGKVHRIYQEPLEWPYSSMLRYSFFLSIEDRLKEYEYCFFFNANSEALKDIDEAMFLPRKEYGEHLVFVQHLSFFDKPNYLFTYDRNPFSHAYIPYGVGKAYVVGGVNGGETEYFLKMCKTINDWTNKDLKKNIIALWHDESYINRYYLKRKKDRLLGPSYVYPESYGKNRVEPIILMREKNRYFAVDTVKKEAPQTSLRFPVRLWNKVNLKIAVVADKLKGRKQNDLGHRSDL